MLQNGGATTTAEVVKDTTTQAFMKDVIEESRRQPVLVDFWAPWCGPCKQLTPVLEKAVKAAKGKVKLAKMNIDEHPAIPGQMGIQSIPAVIAFSNGQPVDGFMGALPESQVAAFLERITKGAVRTEDKDLLKAADAALAETCLAPPKCMRNSLPKTAPTSRRSPDSRVPMCRPARSSRPNRRSPRSKRSELSRPLSPRAALEVAEQAKSVGPLAELEENDSRSAESSSTFRPCGRAQREGKRDDAVKHLLEIVKRDRKWNDDGARKQLVQLFEAWGPTDRRPWKDASVCLRFCFRKVCATFAAPSGGVTRRCR